MGSDSKIMSIMKIVNVNNGQIAELAYEWATLRLQITYRNGKKIIIERVSVVVFEKMRCSSDPVQFLDQNILRNRKLLTSSILNYQKLRSRSK